jgi:hypothetical protein
MTADLVERLAQHRALAGVPRQELEWLVNHGEVIQLAVGDVLTSKSGPVRGLFIVLAGHLSIYVDRGAGPIKVMAWHGGDVTGLLPYSRLVAPPSDVKGRRTHGNPADPARGHSCADSAVSGAHGQVRAHHGGPRPAVHVGRPAERKALVLGKLAAGLAHELNNPASAVVAQRRGPRAQIDRRRDRLARVRRRHADTGAAFGGGPCPVALYGTRRHVRSHGACASRSEERIVEWLEDHGADPLSADTLVDSAITEDVLDQLAAAISGDSLQIVLQVLVAECSAHQLVNEIQASASRIHKLVAAVKGFTYMDQAAQQQPVDIGKALSDTLVVLNSKARTKNVTVSLTSSRTFRACRRTAARSIRSGRTLSTTRWMRRPAKSQSPLSPGTDLVVTRDRRWQRHAAGSEEPASSIPSSRRSRRVGHRPRPRHRAALVTAASRTIAVESHPGRTEFTVTLPIDPAKSGQVRSEEEVFSLLTYSQRFQIFVHE